MMTVLMTTWKEVKAVQQLKPAYKMNAMLSSARRPLASPRGNLQFPSRAHGSVVAYRIKPERQGCMIFPKHTLN